MTPSTNNNPEAPIKKPSLTESVDSLISKKQLEKSAELNATLQQSTEGIQGEVADLMAGSEKPKEKISEKKGESGEKGDIKASSGGEDDGQVSQIISNLSTYNFPSEEVMIKKVRTAINSQIKMEMKKAAKLKKNLATGSAEEYNSSIARIRKLKGILSNLFSQTVDLVKNLYSKYFTPDGKRKDFE